MQYSKQEQLQVDIFGMPELNLQCRNAQAMPDPPSQMSLPKNSLLPYILPVVAHAEVTVKSKGIEQSMENTEGLFRKFGGLLFLAYCRMGNGEPLPAATISGRIPLKALGKMMVAVDVQGTLVSRRLNDADLTATRCKELAGLPTRLLAAYHAKVQANDIAISRTMRNPRDRTPQNPALMAEVTIRIIEQN